MIKQQNPVTGKPEIRGIQTNPNVVPARSHHAANAHLPGGEKYTAFTKWRRRVLAVILAVLLAYAAYVIVVNMNANGLVQAPSGPENSQITTDFQKKAKPEYDTMKYISDTSTGTPDVENIDVGRVVTTAGDVSVGYACEATADVKFSNSSINSTSKMRMKYAYNSLLHTWEAGEISIEQSNYRPNSGPDMQKIQDDAINLLSAYDENIASTMSGAKSTREGDISKDGGEVTLTLTKKGAGENGVDLVKTMTTRVEWSEISGWVASVARVTTEGAGVETEEERKAKEEEEKKKLEAENQNTNTANTSTEATMELSCENGSLVQLSGTISGTTLTTETTKYVIDGTEITTNTVTITGDTGAVAGMSAAAISGYISLNDGQVSIEIPG